MRSYVPRRALVGLTAVVASLALGLVGVPAASADSTVSKRALSSTASAAPLYNLPISGVGKNGKKFEGNYGIRRFVVKGDQVMAVGTLTGTLKNRHVRRSNVMMPASLTGSDSSSSSSGFQIQQQTCTVLHLVLGPINLNLLGLHVTLGGGPNANLPIVLDITAEQGGGLLGDLLCGLTNALNQQGILTQLSNQLQQLAATLNSLISLLGGLQQGA